MPLLFLITYIAISYFIFRKNKNNIDNIPFVLQMTWIIAFILLFVFIIYYSEINLSWIEEVWYTYSFYSLWIWYVITYIVYFLEYKKILKSNNFKILDSNNVWLLETIIDKSYFVIIIILSLVYFLYTNPWDVIQDDWLQVLFYMFFIFSSAFVLFKNKLLS